jgi:hypothetical protein
MFGLFRGCSILFTTAQSMVELEEVVARLQEAPATEPIASEIGGPFTLSLALAR